MAKTTLNFKCPFCGKVSLEVRRDTMDGEINIELTCGHSFIKRVLDTSDVSIVSKDGRSPFPYQMFSAKFMEDADCNGLILHEQGLGKTVIECLLLMRNPELFPALIVVKSGLRAQWFAEIFRWTGKIAQVITTSTEKPLFELFDIVIVSVDTLRILRPDVKVDTVQEIAEAESKGRKLKERLPVWTDAICAHFKHVCIDESQHIKNPGSARTQALRKIVKAANDGQKARVICMSGTNIEKHAGEYFVTLNLVQPMMFPVQAQFLMQHVETNEDGKPGGLKDPERFKEMTGDFIIRYKREDVLPDLPKVFRQFRLAEMEGDELQAYIKVVKEFQKLSEDPDVNLSQTDILGYLSRMRHITGIAKVPAAVRFVEEFLFESERKLVIFLHHKQAAAILDAKLQRLFWTGDADLALSDKEVDKARFKKPVFEMPLQLNSAMTLNERTQAVEDFKKPENRILIASTLAAGEGLNLQFCSDCLIMERQWNPSKEEQAEGRFPRPGSVADKINAHYLIAAGTIDDFLTDIVERKRRNVAQTLDGKEINWDEASLMVELMSALRTKGLRKWGL